MHPTRGGRDLVHGQEGVDLNPYLFHGLSERVAALEEENRRLREHLAEISESSQDLYDSVDRLVTITGLSFSVIIAVQLTIFVLGVFL